MRPVCCICGKPITARFWVCAACEDAYELKGGYHDWPEWIQALVILEQRERRRVEEPTFSDVPVAERMYYGELNDDAWHYDSDDGSDDVWYTESD